MTYKVDNAIIMAAGLSSRFVPLSYEKPKALIKVKGEVLIERQIKQLHEAGIKQIIIVTGYKHEQFEYLKDKYQVILIHNNHYYDRNNHYSLWKAKDYLKNSYICSADNYFKENPFEAYVDESYYSSIYVDGKTNEWCITYDDNDYIKNVVVGGNNSYIMLGHVFFDETFSKHFIEILENTINTDEIKDKLWEDIYLDHISEFNMKIKKYNSDYIYEFDSLDELREFDKEYKIHSNSNILDYIKNQLNIEESEMYDFTPIKNKDGLVSGFNFNIGDKLYTYDFNTKVIGG